MAQNSVHSEATGPLFNGLATIALRAMSESMVDTLARDAQHLVLENLHHDLKSPTGYYESHIRVDRVNNDRVVNDSGVVYGPWLEGVSSRNQSTSFKGYHDFRKAAQELQHSIGVQLGLISAKYVKQMGGV